MAVAGAAGAAALNLSRLATAAVATGDGWGAVMRLARTTRINMEYADVNAAGSVLRDAAVSCRRPHADDHPRRARIVAAAAALVLGLALWLTSSRAAIVGVLVVGGLSAIVTFVRSGAWGGRLPGRAAAPAATIVPIAAGPGRGIAERSSGSPA